MARKGTERLPEFSFKKYLGIQIHDIEDPHDIIKHIIEAIEKALEKIKSGQGELSLLAIILYDGDWELRIWIDPERNEATILHNIHEETYTGDIYRITIEEFTVTRMAMDMDKEIAESRGLKPVTVPIDLLPSLLAKTLRLKLLEQAKPKREPPKPQVAREAGAAQPQAAQAQLPQAKAIPLVVCLERLWSTCSTVNCDALTDPMEQLESIGIAILGGGSEYTCIIKDAEGCPYLIVSFSAGRVNAQCAKGRGEVEDIVKKLRARGYEAAIA